MVNCGRKRCKICGGKLIKKGFDKANNQIWYCKHYHRHYVFKRKDIHDISKFRNTNIFLPGDSQQYDQIFVDALWLWYIFWDFTRKLNHLKCPYNSF